MAALMSSQPPGPVAVAQYAHSSGGSGGGGGVMSPRPTTSAGQQSHHQQQQNLHSALRSPTSDQQQTRPPRTVRVQQPAPGNGHAETSSQGRPRTGGSGGGAPQHRVRQPPQNPQSQQQQQPTSHPTSHPHAGSRAAGNSNGNANGSTNVNNNSNPSTRPEPPPRESSQSRSTNAAGSTTRNSHFPHAFERWEILSSRWEGLTGYWISKLEQNRHELANMPLDQQMSRQITDLSAAGANLFHAVVELQRLRASSERKFQRWFFETRADQERAREMSSELEATLRVERQKRADAMAVIARLEKEKSTAEKLVEEYRRELHISREECRRSWEELGRREQEERERRNSLRDGNVTLVGDYQVLPMPMPGVSRRTSGSGHPQSPPGGQYEQGNIHHDQSHGPMSGSQPHSSTAGGATIPSSSQHGSRSPISYPPQQGAPNQRHDAGSPQLQQFYQHDMNPGITDEQGRPYSPGAESFVTNDQDELQNPADYGLDYPASPDYQQQRRRRPDSVTETDMSDEEAINTVPGAEFGGNLAVEYQRDENGHLVLDSKGDPIIVSYRHSRIDPEDAIYPDYDGSGYGAPIQAPNPPLGGNYGVNYYGAGYGPGWEGIARHHHPTRLSDVVEEEERTHTSASVRSR